MKQVITNNMRKLLTVLCAFALSGTGAFGYDVWLGLPYFPKGADTTLKSQWELTASMLDGLNPNLSQTKTPVDERNTTADWKNIIGLMPTAKNNAMHPMPRTHFNYGTRTDRGTLAEYCARTFKNEPKYGYKIKWVMPFDNQPGEDRTLPIQQWTDAQLQELRDWLDNNGRANVRIITNVRNNGAGPRANVQKDIGRYNYSLTDNGWKHYAMVKGGSSYQLYINGVPTPSSPLAPPIDYNETTPIPFFIGGDDDGDIIKPNEHFKGGIDDVVLYRSALTQTDIANVMNGNHDQTITMVALGSPVDSTAGSTWSDEAPAHGFAKYIIPATGNLRGESGTTTFPGTSLTVQAGGKFQVRAIDGSDETTTVDNLILSGGAGLTVADSSTTTVDIGNYTWVVSSLMNGSTVEFRYPRSTAALADGMIFEVQWSDTLLPSSWSSVGIVDRLDVANPGNSEVKNRIATVPAGTAGKRFIHLKVLKP